MATQDYPLTVIENAESLQHIEDGRCPFCLSERTSFGGVSDSSRWCLDCSGEWLMERKLIGIRIVKHPPSEV